MTIPWSIRNRALDMWSNGCTAPDIAEVLGAPKKTVENCIVWGRRHGDRRAKRHSCRPALLGEAFEPDGAPLVIRQPDGPHAPADLTRAILYEVAVAHGVNVAAILSARMAARLLPARREAARRLRVERKLSTTQIGRILGNRHHTTILNLLGRTRAAAERVAAATERRP